MSRHTIFITLIIAVLSGIFIGNILLDPKLIVSFICIFLVFLILLLIGAIKHLFFIVVFGVGIGLGSIISILHNSEIEKKKESISSYLNKSTTFEGKVDELYKKYENVESYIIQIESLAGKETKEISFLIMTPLHTNLTPGEIITISGKVDKIENFSRQFNYEKYLQSKNIFFIINTPQIEKTKKKEISFFKTKIWDFRQSILEIIYEIYPENHASLLAGLLIGAKENIDTNLLEDFNHAGLTHIISVSGFNISILIIFLGYIFKLFPLGVRSILISCIVIMFVFLVGSSVAVIRAAGMGLIGYYVLLGGRKANSLAIILLTALLMVVREPLILNYDISFQLSFLSVMGILYFQEWFKKIFFFLPQTFAIQESFVLTLAALMSTLPIMVFNFGQIALLAPFSNFLVGGMIPFTMLFGFLSILAEYISPSIGYIIGYVNFFFLDFIIKVATYIGNLSFAVIHVEVGVYGIFYEIIYFMVVVFGILYFKKEKSPTL